MLRTATVERALVRVWAGRMFKWVRSASISNLVKQQTDMTMISATNWEAKSMVSMEKLAPEKTRGGGQWPAVLAIRWRQVASAAEQRAAEAASAMAEAVTVMVEAAAVAGMAP